MYKLQLNGCWLFGAFITLFEFLKNVINASKQTLTATVCFLSTSLLFIWCFAGMMIRPRGELLEIAYTTEYTETWERYVQALNNFLSREFFVQLYAACIMQ